MLEIAYADSKYLQILGKRLDDSRGQGYVILRDEPRFKWKRDNEFGKLLFERLHRNVLETASRIIYSDYTRRDLVSRLLKILVEDVDQLVRLVTCRRIPSDLARRVKQSVGKKYDNAYHYALTACRQVRNLLRKEIRDSFPNKEGEKELFLSHLQKDGTPEKAKIVLALSTTVRIWSKIGFPFLNPIFRRNTIDFAASTENATAQGYWFESDGERDDEIILYIKTPPGIIGHRESKKSPYKSQTIKLRFLNWMPGKAERARLKAQIERSRGNEARAIELEFRAEKFEDMSHQLKNVLKLQFLTRKLSKLRLQKKSNEREIARLKERMYELRDSRRCAPPIIQLKDKKAILTIPFMAPDKNLLERTLPVKKRSGIAGVDRGLRYAMVVSAKNDDVYEEIMIGRQDLLKKRDRLRLRTRELMSQISRKRNNWEKKKSKLPPPSLILKKERDLESVWRKIRRLDKEISHQVANETVWFCEHRGVERLHFEDLRSFTGKAGMKTHSWNLSTNLWGEMIKGVRYRRQALGHRSGGVWTVNPAWTSQTCSVCGERGFRVPTSDSTTEKKGGEFFYCERCEIHLHADVNAARNIIHVKTEPSAVS
ncbi:MAG: zinc ribbon domain-containing protein, partial [Candidatus Thorarchaeota archaeon]